MKKVKILTLLLALIMLFSLFALPACDNNGSTDNSSSSGGNASATVRVMVEQGAHYQVVGEGVKDVNVGEDVSFYISIDEGYYYVSNNSGAEFSENQLTLRNVMMPRTIRLEVKAYTYTVRLNETEGLKVKEGESFVQKAASLEVSHGENAVFDVEIDEGYEYYENTVTSEDGNNQQAVYEDGKLTVENVCSDKEIFVQLRKKAVAEQEKVTVKLVKTEAFVIKGESEQVVESGTDVEFEIIVREGYYYLTNNCGAEYDSKTGKVIFRNARADQTIRLSFRKQNTDVSYDDPNGTVESSVEGENVIYTAKSNANYVFTGWYYTKEGEEGEESEDIFYSYANNLKVSGSVAADLDLKPTFAWSATHKTVTYHANGGKIYGSEDETITDAFRHEVYLYPAALGEWCFNTFYREGYVPIEYNTKADGSGEAFSLGSRIFSDVKKIDLYVIWAEENKASDFTYTYLDENDRGAGIELVKYTGTDLSVVIPNYIEGSPVKVIGGTCFEGQNIESAVLTRNLTEIKIGAFANCRALTTVYMCDSVEKVYDESFSNCTSLANLRMIAALPPVYSDHLIGATVRRFELLYSIRNNWATNILFYGGSSTFHGIGGETLDKKYFSSYRVINCAQNAHVSGPLMMELYSHFMKENDVMVFMPEYSARLYSSALELPSWIALEAFYDAFRYIDLRNYSNVFDAFYDIQHGSESYVYVGKLQQIKDKKGFSYYTYDDTFDEYFTRAENFVISKVTLKTETEVPKFEEMKRFVLSDIEMLYERCYEGRLKMYFAYFAFWENAYDKSVHHEKYEQWLKENLPFPYISNYRNHMYGAEYMSDSISHLTREGAVLHSEVIGAELTAQMNSEA